MRFQGRTQQNVKAMKSLTPELLHALPPNCGFLRTHLARFSKAVGLLHVLHVEGSCRHAKRSSRLRRRRRFVNKMTDMRRFRIPVAIVTIALAALVVRCAAQAPAAALTREVPWSGKGVWLAADTHVHTKFSDGAGTPAETTAKARSFGCDVVGFADHGDNDRKGATTEYFDAIDEARRAQPE